MSHDVSDMRRQIYDTILRFPGIHFRELIRTCYVSNGQLRHHISKLKTEGVITEEKNKRNARFYPLGLNSYERAMLGLLRNATSRQIIIFLLKQPSQAHKSINEHVKVSQSTLSWYLKRLRKHGVIAVQTNGKENYYSLNNYEEIARIIHSHKDSIFDKFVNNFIESWNDRFI